MLKMLNKTIKTFYSNDSEIESFKHLLPSFDKDDIVKITLILDQNDIPSNEYGPAIIVETKQEIIKSYIKNGFYHRLFGPAIEYSKNSHLNKYITNGILLNHETVISWIEDNNLSVNNLQSWSICHKLKYLKNFNL